MIEAQSELAFVKPINYKLLTMNCILVLHDIRSVHNAGSIFRSADGAGVSRIILSGYTAGPIDHVGRSRPDFLKVSLGAEASVPWERSEAVLSDLVSRLRREGYTIAALERTEGAQDIFSYEAPEKLALFLGNEVDGVPSEVLSEASVTLAIPMRGVKESLNVSVATGVALYALLRD
jgi:23S rRNA (guanosine2251-2'-O)-methyltransferase